MNINGGKVTVRGIYARNGNSSATISNGGVLEVGEMKLDGNWPLACGEGTIRALAYTGATGITDNQTVTFTDTEVGTTLDPNGLAINFTGTASGAGNVTVSDSVKGGTVTFADVSGLTGTFAVLGGALYVPTDASIAIDEQTTEKTISDRENYDKYVNKDASYAVQCVFAGNETVYKYESLAAAMAAVGANPGTITLLADCTGENAALSPGQTIVAGGYAIGTVSATNGAELDVNGTTYGTIDNSRSTWQPVSGGDNKWGTAANWSTGYVPNQYTVVTFPEGTYSVGLSRNNGDVGEWCGGMVVNGEVSFNRAAGQWAYVRLYGDVSGSGTLTLRQTGFDNFKGSEVVIGCGFVAHGEGADSFVRCDRDPRVGYKFTGDVTVKKGLFKVENCNGVFDGAVTVEQDADFRGAGNTAGSIMTFNGAVSGPASGTTSLKGSNEGTNRKVVFNGDISGNLSIECYGETELRGDNSGFTGTFKKQVNPQVKFFTDSSGSALADWVIEGSMALGDDVRAIEFGSLTLARKVDGSNGDGLYYKSTAEDPLVFTVGGNGKDSTFTTPYYPYNSTSVSGGGGWRPTSDQPFVLRKVGKDTLTINDTADTGFRVSELRLEEGLVVVSKDGTNDQGLILVDGGKIKTVSGKRVETTVSEDGLTTTYEARHSGFMVILR